MDQTPQKSQDLKQKARAFLELVVQGKIDEAYTTYVHEKGIHHNFFFPAGFAALKKGMEENQQQFPKKQLLVKHIIADDHFVAVHSHLKLTSEHPGMAVVHILRFEDGKIIEMWDCGQPLPTDTTETSNIINTDGFF